MRQYPIWNDINTNGGKKSSSNFGVLDSFAQDVYVGTSSRNSHLFVKIEVERHELLSGLVEFALYIDGVIVKHVTLDGKEFNIAFDRADQAD